jgi:hypothetical protein
VSGDWHAELRELRVGRCPGLSAIARVLQGSESRDADLQTLLRAQLLFWMLAATDGHAKNFSVRLLAQGRYQLHHHRTRRSGIACSHAGAMLARTSAATRLEGIHAYEAT